MAIKRDSRPEQVRGYLDDVHEMTIAADAPAAPSPEPAAPEPADSPDPPAHIQSTEFTVTLEGLDPAAKITVTKMLHRLTDLGLRESRDLVERAPQPIKENISRDEAESIKEELEQAGAHVSVDLSNVARQWRAVSDKLAEGDVVEGEVVRKIKGGLIVDIGVNVFLPASQVDLRRPADCGDYVGRRISCKILSIDRVRRNIVVSRRQLLEDERAENKKRLLSEIEPGQVRKGNVTRITDFGAFVDLGGIEGLIHISEMSWDRVKDPRDVVRIDQQLEVRVLNVDIDRERIQLSLKDTHAARRPAKPGALAAPATTSTATFSPDFQEMLARVGSVLRARGIGAAEAAEIVLEIARMPPQTGLPANAEAASVVLERFSGFVDRVEGETAYVTLTSEHGDTLLGEYPFSDLRKLGIQERRGFECATLKTGGKIVVDLHALPPRALSQQEHDDIRSRVDQLVANAEFDGE